MSLLDFFGGLSQGVGSAWMRGEDFVRRQQEEQRQQQLGVLKSAFDKAAEEGNNAGASTALRMAAPLMGAKPGKPHPINMFADMIDHFTPVTKDVVKPEAIEAQAQIDKTPATITTQPSVEGVPPTPGYDRQSMNQPAGGVIKKIEPTTIDNPALLNLERPRTAIDKQTTQQGYFKTPIERGQEQIELRKKQQEELLPLELKEYGAKEGLRAKVWQSQEDIRQAGRERLAKLRDEGYASRDLNKTAAAYKGSINSATGLQYTDDEAMEAARQYHRDKNQAVLSEYKSKGEARLAQQQFRERELDARINRWNALDEQAWAKIGQAERKMNMQQGSVKASVERLRSYRAELKDIAIQQDLAFRTMTDQMKGEDKRQEAKQLFDQLNVEYDKRLDAIEKENTKIEQAGQAFQSQQPALTRKGEATKSINVQHKIGDIVPVKGQNIKITKINPDGTYSGVPVP